ncbi:chemotaxis protein CheA [Desulforamulus aeronauticus]|uniref:Chemotaxis protein CheA n=1 Tax=Desulforamulus aeronauticus DSM 10349 TaxID=1121421 RepID=A0A1M6REH0_9FIRM|nr:chemotaxis protein CheA [Desulforamulus aeronauticus]SHK30813.1 two-component system, chemotaxis family, sensor kinase CheA [Desulforamulus aeronauticus DSM 10349]
MFSDLEIGVFIDELEEKIQVINDGLLALERDEGNPDIIQEIFRAAHTIKGSSGIMGYQGMASLTHEMENLFDKIRHGEIHVTSVMVNVLFEALDTLKALKDEVTGDGPAVDTSSVVGKIKAFVEGGGQAQHNETPEASQATTPVNEVAPDRGWIEIGDVEENVIREAELRGYQCFRVAIDIDRDCQMKNVRAFLVFETLQQNGEILKSEPPVEEIQDGKYDVGFQVVLITKEDADRIKNLMITISEVADADVQPVVLQQVESYVEKAVVKEAVGTVPVVQENGIAKQQESSEKKAVKTVRVDVTKLDNLMNLVGELVIDRTRLNRFAEIFESRFGSDDLVESINEISNHLGQVTGDLQEQIMKARMLPVAQLFNRFPRMVRDTAQKLNKEIDFVVEGKETELDRNVIEVIGDPLIHLIRNSIDHGIETPEERLAAGKPAMGTLLLKASYAESHIVITVQDDGRGIDANKIRNKAVEMDFVDRETADRMSDREALQLIFRAGLSTKNNAVSDLSGRGVGMDVVNTAIEQINGIVEMDTRLGAGTTITIRLPLTLAIIRALMITLGKQVYAFPLTNVSETIRITDQDVRRIRNSEVIVVRDRILPLARLGRMFNCADCAEDSKMFVVILGSGDKRIAVVVDKLMGEQEIVIKSLGDYLGQVHGLSGACILGDGKVALIVDVRGLVKDLGAEEAAYAAG